MSLSISTLYNHSFIKLSINFIFDENDERIFRRKLQIHLLLSPRYRVPRESPYYALTFLDREKRERPGKLIRAYRPVEESSTDP